MWAPTMMLIAWPALALSVCQAALAQCAGRSGKHDLLVAERGQTTATIAVPGQAAGGQFERMAADDLAKYIALMSGARPAISHDAKAIADALASTEPVFLIGSEALKADGGLTRRLKVVAKTDPQLRADAIVVRRRRNRVYLAGLTDDGHYHAVSHLLHLWGCRWYMPTEFGECIPEHATLTVGALDHAYASPFELRGYWLSWNGNSEGRDEFSLRNFMTRGVPTPGSGHALRRYTEELVPPGKSIFDIPVAEEKTITHVAEKIEDVFRDNGTVSLAMEDGLYESDSPADVRLRAGLWDKYTLKPSMTDVFMTLYNGVCERLLRQYPESAARIGFLAYSNMTIPPQQVTRAAKPLICALAPIDVDPIHGMDDPRSPPRREYREMMCRWAEVMQGRVWIYDYDQGMLVWRDIPNPSHQAFRQDVQHYRKAGILGVFTESRGAIATTFLNLHLRGQLMWNPDLDVEAHLAEFYEKFYGPAAAPMAHYWNAIFRAWEETICTEHEFFVAPAVYTPELMRTLRRELGRAEQLVRPLAARRQASRNEELCLQRMRFTRLSLDLLHQYMTMVRAAATDCHYGLAHEAGKRALETRLELAQMNPTFTTRVIGPAEEPKYGGSPAWLPGEVKLYGDLERLTAGTEGDLLVRLPLEWAFRRDPRDTGLVRGWAGRPADLTYWREHSSEYGILARKDYPAAQWEMIRTDLYPQAQGVLHPDWQSYTGHSWYKAQIQLKAAQTKGEVHIRFPGLFAEAWLYVNGRLVAHRPQAGLWWRNDYAFSWDVDVSGRLRSGRNDITVRNHNAHHLSGMFRRPFLYRPTGQ